MADVDLVAMRRAIRASRVKPETDRRVYCLPTEMLARVLCYQAERGLPSEVAAVRELLDQGLRAKGASDGPAAATVAPEPSV